MAVVLGSNSIQGAANISGSGSNYGIQQTPSGVIRQPKVPAASVRCVGNDNSDKSGIQNLVDVSSVNITVQASPGRITVPVAGKYYVACRQMVSTAHMLFMGVKKNGTAEAFGCKFLHHGQGDAWVEVILDMAANDYIEIEFIVIGGSLTIWTGGYSFLTVYKVA